MVDPTLQAVLNRVEAGEDLSQQDWQVLKTAVQSRQVTIQGSVDRTVIVTGDRNVVGDRNIVISEADAKTIQFLLSKRDRNLTILLQEVKEEVQSRLNQSLHSEVLINLGRESQSYQVRRPWDAEIIIGTKPNESLPPNSSILGIFEQPGIVGKLLILGKPGSGKTTTLLDLSQALVEKAESDPNYPIPVLFDLSDWKSTQQEMKDWLIKKLKSKYKKPTNIGAEWIKEKRLLLLLDGLDEVRPEYQLACVKAINQLLESDCYPLYIAVCSRLEEYEAYEEKLNLNGAVLLHELDNSQIENYLIKVKRSELWQALQSDTDLLELNRSPLLLNIIVLSYDELKLTEWQQADSASTRIKLLLDGYVRRMLAREIKNSSYSNQIPHSDRTQFWLIWLAQQLTKDFQTDFLIEALQPSHLSNENLQRSYCLKIKWGIDLCMSLLFGIFFALTENVTSGVIAGILFGLTSGKKADFFREIEIIENLKWSWSRAKMGLLLTSIALLIVAPILLLIFMLIRPETNLLFVLIATGLVTSTIGLMAGLSGIDLQDKRIPNQGIRNSLNSSLVVGVVGGTLLGTLFLIGFQITSHLTNRLFTGATVLIFLGLILSLNYGGYAVIQHFVLRCLLYSSGVVPWNYARFLNYATERRLLQCIGGRYRFIHRLLQEHFAAMPLEGKLSER